MAWFTRVAVALTVYLTGIVIVSGQESPEKSKLKIEFRWAEEKPTKGLTADKGIDLSCSNKKAYLHTKAIITNRDISEARHRKANAAPADKFIIEVQLTKEAGQRMAQSSAQNLKKPLVVLVDGKVVAAMVVMDQLSNFVPITGYFTEAEAERIIKGVN